MTMLRSLALATAAAGVLAAQDGPGSPKEPQMPNQVRERGRVDDRDRGPTREKGRVGTRGTPKVETVSGILLDAGCRDRTNLNLRQPVVPSPQQQQNGAATGSGAADTG